jgi:hypothetical protein
MGLYLLTSLKWNLSLIYCDDISIEVIPPRNHYAVTVFLLHILIAPLVDCFCLLSTRS